MSATEQEEGVESDSDNDNYSVGSDDDNSEV